MAFNPNLGIITLAIGAQRYIRQAHMLSLSLRRNMPGVSIAVVSDSEEVASFADVVVKVDESIPISAAQKLLLYKYSPFEESLFIDSDCIVARPFHTELAVLRKYSFSPIIEKMVPCEGTDDYIQDLRGALERVGGTAFPKFNGGLYFFNRSNQSREVFEFALDYFRNYKLYGIRPFDRGGPGDETVIALALAHLGQLELYNDAGRLMRTPTGLKGRLTIDPLGGGCSFERAEGFVSPAICHFAGHYLMLPEYFLAGAALRSGVAISDLSLLARARAHADSLFAKTSRFFYYRIHGLQKRAGKLLQY
jgi:hypothetical protein